MLEGERVNATRLFVPLYLYLLAVDTISRVILAQAKCRKFLFDSSFPIRPQVEKRRRTRLYEERGVSVNPKQRDLIPRVTATLLHVWKASNF